MPDTALLLDLDGVVVFEFQRPVAPAAEIFQLHRDLAATLARVQAPIYLLTHRSRSEATQILDAIGLRKPTFGYCFTADDLLSAAVRRWQLRALVSGGLRKSFILPLLHEKHGIAPPNLCFVDDSPGNIADMHRHGVGYALHAPSKLSPDGSVTTFDFEEVVTLFESWREARKSGATAEPITASLTPVRREMEAWCGTGCSSAAAGRTVFNYLRRSFRSARKQLASSRPRSS